MSEERERKIQEAYVPQENPKRPDEVAGYVPQSSPEKPPEKPSNDQKPSDDNN